MSDSTGDAMAEIERLINDYAYQAWAATRTGYDSEAENHARAALTAAIAEVVKDSQRYRFLRDADWAKDGWYCCIMDVRGHAESLRFDKLDTEIDSAIDLAKERP